MEGETSDLYGDCGILTAGIYRGDLGRSPRKGRDALALHAGDARPNADQQDAGLRGGPPSDVDASENVERLGSADKIRTPSRGRCICVGPEPVYERLWDCTERYTSREIRDDNDSEQKKKEATVAQIQERGDG